jgi:glutaminyl-tRNA synthetase
MSKRLLNQLVRDGHVRGWDDPRMPTIAGLRRRGVTPAAIRDFCSRVGVTKQDNRVEMELLEFCVRADLEKTAPRGMAVLEPLKVTITNYAQDTGETLTGPWHAQNEALGERAIPFSGTLYIERSDFEEVPPPKYKRLSPGAMVRLRYAYIIRCDEVVKDADGAVVELKVTYFPDSKSGSDTSGLKPNGVIHWVDAQASLPREVRVFERLFTVPAPTSDGFLSQINQASLETLTARIEPAIEESPQTRFQFERVGYFVKDAEDAGVFNRTVSLRDSYKPEGGK